MRRLLARALISVALLGGNLALTGCVIVPARGHVRV